ncbi:MAG TPA: hypothetical protein VLA09_08230 [Longimicrobiales bacterium]|nr:hypothetical protein [Longimicrobiales bacterium]
MVIVTNNRVSNAVVEVVDESIVSSAGDTHALVPGLAKDAWSDRSPSPRARLSGACSV